jgi:hypothetical protein
MLDWRDPWQAVRATGARWMVVEYDKPADPAETARAGYVFISRMGVWQHYCPYRHRQYRLRQHQPFLPEGAARSEQVRVKCVSDMLMEAAQEKAAEYGVDFSVTDKLSSPEDAAIATNNQGVTQRGVPQQDSTWEPTILGLRRCRRKLSVRSNRPKRSGSTERYPKKRSSRPKGARKIATNGNEQRYGTAYLIVLDRPPNGFNSGLGDFAAK